MPKATPGYSGKPLSAKLGVAEGATVTTLGAPPARIRKAMPPDGVVWVSWPKKASGVATDITEDTIRELAFPLGLVDIKVCAVSDVWSGLKLMIRKELR